MISFLKKLFKWKTLSDIKLHVAGATVRHKGKFKNLPTFDTGKELSSDFCSKWVAPFYLTPVTEGTTWKDNFEVVKDDINIDIAKELLGNFDWRTRITGAYFCGIMNYLECEYIIGNHLLKSEVCFAGHGYCICLASFNTDTSIKFLREYLDYYLTQKKLWFDQGSAFAAIVYLDKINDTDLQKEYIDLWETFIKNKSNWHLSQFLPSFEKEMNIINVIKANL